MLRRERHTQCYVSRRVGGGSVMVWGSFCGNHRGNLHAAGTRDHVLGRQLVPLTAAHGHILIHIKILLLRSTIQVTECVVVVA